MPAAVDVLSGLNVIDESFWGGVCGDNTVCFVTTPEEMRSHESKQKKNIIVKINSFAAAYNIFRKDQNTRSERPTPPKHPIK